MICALTRQTVGKGTDLEREQRKRVQRASARHGLGDGVGDADSHATRRCKARIHGRLPKEHSHAPRLSHTDDFLGRVDNGSERAWKRSAASCGEINPEAISPSAATDGLGGEALPSRMAGLLLGRACLFGHLGPNSPPVIGPQFASSNRACRGMFDRDRSLGRNRRQTGCHLGQVGRRDGQRLSQARGRATRAIRNVGFEVHAPSLVCTKRHGQVFTNLVTYKLSA